MNILLEKILPNPEQPRAHFDADQMRELAESIVENGVILPVSVEESGEFYILHDGERRVRAAKMAGLTEIPAMIVPALNGAGQQNRLTRALVANIQRADLGPVEEARAYKRLRDEMGMKIAQISRMIGVSEPRINSRLRLLELDPEIQTFIENGQLPKDYRAIEALLTIPEADVRVKLAVRLAERRATVKMIQDSVRLVLVHLHSKMIVDHPVPAVNMAIRKAGSVNQVKWDALASLGRRPKWDIVVQNAQTTCRGCTWYENASEAICKDCPLPAFLGRLIESAK